MMLYVGEGPRGSNGTRLTLLRISVFHSATHNQTGPLSCWFPSGWACAHSRPLWVSPMTSPVKLGVSPAAAPTPTGAFNQRFEALFPRAGALGYAACFAPRRLSRFICAQMWGLGVLPATLSLALSAYLRECGATGSSSGQTACPFRPILHQSWSRHSHESPLRSSYRSGCMFLFYLLGVGLPCRFSVSSGCARRRSVSTYAAILVLRILQLLFPRLSWLF